MPTSRRRYASRLGRLNTVLLLGALLLVLGCFAYVLFQNCYYHGDGFGNLPGDAPGYMRQLKHAMGWVVLLAYAGLATQAGLTVLSLGTRFSWWRLLANVVTLGLGGPLLWFCDVYIFW